MLLDSCWDVAIFSEGLTGVFRPKRVQQSRREGDGGAGQDFPACEQAIEGRRLFNMETEMTVLITVGGWCYLLSYHSN